jgi:hypothetical protein
LEGAQGRPLLALRLAPGFLAGFLSRLREWVRPFLTKGADLEFEVVESFQIEDGSRVASARHRQEQGCVQHRGRPYADRVHRRGSGTVREHEKPLHN